MTTGLWDDIDAACGESDRERREVLVEPLAQRLRDLVAEVENADTLYALGYVLYNHPRRVSSSALQTEVEATLRRVLVHDAGHAYAQMYLGYNAYDLGRYEEAKAHFRDADPSRLAPNFALSRDELIVSSDIRMHGLAYSLSALERYVVQVEAASEFDIFPMSLARTLKDSQGAIARLGADDRKRLASLGRRLDRAGHSRDWFGKLTLGS